MARVADRRPGTAQPLLLLLLLVLTLALATPVLSSPLAGTATASARPALRVHTLTVEHLREPLGIDAPRPRLAWATRSTLRDVRPTAYQVLVSATRATLDAGRGDVWDSGKRTSGIDIGATYDGPPLASTTRYFWMVRVWDQHGGVSPWSQAAWFETAFLDPAAEFPGQWIGRAAGSPQETPEPLLRKEFTVRGPIASARLHIAGLGYYVAQLNGARVGDHEMDPGFTTYSSRAYYVTHDVTRQLVQGDNALGVRLGRGYYATKGTVILNDNHNWTTSPWRSEPKLKSVLRIRYRDGSTQDVVSDTSWRTEDGPTTNEVPGNETYDARLEKPGWTLAGYDDSAWDTALAVLPPSGRCDVVDSAPNLPVGGCQPVPARLQSQPNEPQRVTARYEPVKVSTPAAGNRVYAFPTMTAGWARIVFDGKPGTKVTVRYSEKLNPDGTAPQQGLSEQDDVYILKGGGPEVYRPAYSYKGFQYVQVMAADMPKVLDVTAEQVTNALTPIGSFTSSNAQLNAYHRAMKLTSLFNLHSIPTDTPTYEKAGWTADAHLFGTSVMRNYAGTAFYEKYSVDMNDAQLPSGDVPSIVPAPADLNYLLDPAWGGAIVLVHHDLYMTSGDLHPIRRDYPFMARWMSLMETQAAATGYVYSVPVAFGDWVTPLNGKVPSGQVHGTGYVYRAATMMAELAAAIGETADAERWRTLADRMRTAYNARFYDAASGRYLNPQGDPSPYFREYGTAEAGAYAQTTQALALAWGIAQEADSPVDEQKVFANLAADVREKGNHLATGASGTKWLLPVLSDGGESELAYKVALNKTFPGWGFWFAKGATSMWENWNEESRSRGHAFLGTVDDWLYTHVAGLRVTSPGYRTFDVKPYPGGGLRHAAARQETPLGTAATCWRSGPAGALGVDVVVPPGATAQVHVPAADEGRVQETGQGIRVPASKAPGVVFVEQKDGRAVFRVASGAYRFVIGDPPGCSGFSSAVASTPIEPAAPPGTLPATGAASWLPVVGLVVVGSAVVVRRTGLRLPRSNQRPSSRSRERLATI